MSRLVRPLALMAVVALALTSFGCLQVETKYTIYPDGSGRVITTMKVDQQAMEMMKTMSPQQGEGKEMPGAPDVKGLVGGQKMTIVTEGIFADVNKVESPGVKIEWRKLKSGGSKLKMDLDLSKAGGPGVMPGGMGMPGGPGAGPAPKKTDKPVKKGDKPEGESLVDGKGGSETEGEEEGGGSGEDMASAFAKEMFKGMAVKYIVVMPGKVTKSSSEQIDGRIVTLALDAGDLAKKDKNHTLTASCAAPDEAGQAEFEAFKKEIEEAAKKAGSPLGKAAGPGGDEEEK